MQVTDLREEVQEAMTKKRGKGGKRDNLSRDAQRKLASLGEKGGG